MKLAIVKTSQATQKADIPTKMITKNPYIFGSIEECIDKIAFVRPENLALHKLVQETPVHEEIQSITKTITNQKLVEVLLLSTIPNVLNASFQGTIGRLREGPSSHYCF